MAWQAAASTTVVARVSRADRSLSFVAIVALIWRRLAPSQQAADIRSVKGFPNGCIMLGIARFASQNDKFILPARSRSGAGFADERLLLAVEAQKYPTPSGLRPERQATSRRRRVP